MKKFVSRFAAIIKSIGLLLIVLGLVFTIYGHVADQPCLSCDTKPRREQIDSQKQINEDVITWMKTSGPILMIVGFMFIFIGFVCEKKYKNKVMKANTDPVKPIEIQSTFDLLTDIQMSTFNRVVESNSDGMTTVISMDHLPGTPVILSVPPSYEESLNISAGDNFEEPPPYEKR